MVYIRYTLAIVALCLVEMTMAHLNRDPMNPLGEEINTSNEFGNLTIFKNRIDHFDDSNTKTYDQRYWVNEQYYEHGGPVILYICGEWTCSAGDPAKNPAFQLGIKHKGILVTLEHRFYGESQPFTQEEGGWNVQNLKYLNTTQALADIAAFIDDFNINLQQDQWLIVGGSYPGALVAWFKNRYPNHVKAAWSSSGVINAIEDFTAFDMDIFLQTQKNLGGCHIEIAQVTLDIERVLLFNTTAEKEALYDMFGNKNYQIDHNDFMWFISDIFTMGVQYGNRTYLCDILEHEWFKIAPIQIVANLAQDAFKVSADQYDAEALMNTTIDTTKNGRQWTW